MIPLNLCCLAAYARRENPDVEFKILDADVRGLSHEETLQETAAFAPDLIGVTTTTSVFDAVIDLISRLKRCMRNVPVVIGGPHPSALPETSLAESGADFAAVGEGEITFSELITALKKGTHDWRKIDGLVYRDDDRSIGVNKARELIEDLDGLPFAARDLLDNSLYSHPPTLRVALAGRNGGKRMLALAHFGCSFLLVFLASPASVAYGGLRARRTRLVVLCAPLLPVLPGNRAVRSTPAATRPGLFFRLAPHESCPPSPCLFRFRHCSIIRSSPATSTGRPTLPLCSTA